MLAWGRPACRAYAHHSGSACSIPRALPNPGCGRPQASALLLGALVLLAMGLDGSEAGWAAWVGPGLLPTLTASPIPTVRLHDSISEEGFHYLVFDL